MENSLISMKSTNVYIDGACSNNGKPDALAGYGIYFKENDPRNESKRVEGKQSNNTGELTAFIRTLEILKEEIETKEQVHLYTDSEYVIKCVTTYGSKLEKNNWKNSKDQVPPNLKLVQTAYNLFKNVTNVILHHIEAHTNKDDIHSKGNAEADRLARLSIGETDESIETKELNREIILDWVSFDNKDQAKVLGAKWDVKKKLWYAPSNISKENMEGLLELKTTKVITTTPKQPPSTEPRTYIKVSFSKKDKAKGLGARWDASVKSWYYIASQLSDEKIKDLKNI
jgi:ribonuclease HI